MDALLQFLARDVGPLTVQQWLVALAVTWVALSVLQGIARRARTTSMDKDTRPMRCPGCGWHGRVSRFHRTCPKCGDSITPTRTMPSV